MVLNGTVVDNDGSCRDLGELFYASSRSKEL